MPEKLKSELVEVIRFLHAKGWAPATSSNYSFRAPQDKNMFWISKSGIDKGAFSTEDLMLINNKAEPFNGSFRSSAETLLHLLIYEKYPHVNCVLHTHTVNNTVLSRIFESSGEFILEGYEMQKALSGITTHQSAVSVPVFGNSQDMNELSAEIKGYLNSNETHAFLLAGHGMYTWGATIAEAKRHVEALEFLFECEIKRKIYGSFSNS